MRRKRLDFFMYVVICNITTVKGQGSYCKDLWWLAPRAFSVFVVSGEDCLFCAVCPGGYVRRSTEVMGPSE